MYGTRLTEESGVFTSPNYPNSYPNSIAFIWLINTTRSKYVELTFHDFDVEPYKDCSADYVKIRNKRSRNGNFKDVAQIGKSVLNVYAVLFHVTFYNSFPILFCSGGH